MYIIRNKKRHNTHTHTHAAHYAATQGAKTSRQVNYDRDRKEIAKVRKNIPAPLPTFRHRPVDKIGCNWVSEKGLQCSKNNKTSSKETTGWKGKYIE